MILSTWRWIWLILSVAFCVGVASSAGPIRVFVLAGQSNMVGPGSVAHLQQLVQNQSTTQEYQHLWNGTNWKEREDVFIKFEDQSGKLTVGYGEPFWKRFGPELEFGWVIGDALHRHHDSGNNSDDKILLIKTAWGGASLAIDFRPPHSGIGNYTTCDNNQQCRRLRPLDYGIRYRNMVSIVQDTLANIKLYVPGYDPTQGYQISGFVWFQGWNDVLDWNKVNEYEYNLQNLIRDIRQDLDAASDMPFIIGELGQAGLHPSGRGSDRHVAIRRIQEQVAHQMEFRNNTRFVKTSPYVIDKAESFAGGYHYYGRADTFCHIGKAFGQAMLELLQTLGPASKKVKQLIGIDTASN